MRFPKQKLQSLPYRCLVPIINKAEAERALDILLGKGYSLIPNCGKELYIESVLGFAPHNFEVYLKSLARSWSKGKIFTNGDMSGNVVVLYDANRVPKFRN